MSAEDKTDQEPKQPMTQEQIEERLKELRPPERHPPTRKQRREEDPGRHDKALPRERKKK